MTQKKILALALLGVSVLIAVLVSVCAFTRPQLSPGSKTIRVEVVHKDSTSRTFTYRTDADFLGEVLLEEGLVTGEISTYGLYISSVDGEVADYSVDKGYWALFQDGAYATQGADTTPIADGDCFSLVYTIG